MDRGDASRCRRTRPAAWRSGIQHTFLILAIATGVWFAAALVVFVEDLGLHRYRLDVPDNRYARRVRTQVLILRRLTVVAAVVIGLGAILLTFPALQAAGASLLASAGIIGIIAGVAAQSSLANLFAGIQLAFSDAIRIDDVVVVEQQWGTIEEITLTYVVVHVWDDRRLVLPSTYFTTKPFENWTRQHSELLGSVEFDLDWRVSTGGMRAELNRVLAATDLWDKPHRRPAGHGRGRRLGAGPRAGHGQGRADPVRPALPGARAPDRLDAALLAARRSRASAWSWSSRRKRSSVPPRARSEEEGRLFSGTRDGEQRAQQFTDAIPVVRAPDGEPISIDPDDIPPTD